MVFQKYSKYYDLLYKDKDYESEVEYVNGLIERFSKRRFQSVLDFGCGTGIHAQYLSNKGYNVHGVDRSKDMIKIARQKEHKKLKFSLGDITTIDLNKKFDVVISLFHVFSYITINKNIDNLLANVSGHLKNNGLFIFDCWYGPAVLTHKPEVRVKRLEDGETIITRYARPVMHPNENVVDVQYEIIIEEIQGNATERFSEVHSMRYFFKPELEEFLHTHGFTLIHGEEWMTGRPPGFDTWGVCWVAQKVIE